jgi:hypothetical protein
MIYKGIEFSVVQGIEPQIWKWSVSIGNNAKIGQAKSKPDAVIAAWRTIDKTLGKKHRPTISRYAAGLTTE